MSVDLNGIITWLKGWFYDKTEITGFLNNKANQSDLQTLQGTVTSLGETVNGKIDTAGTGLSKSGTTLNHSNSITAQSSTVFKKIKYDGQGHITGTANVDASDLPSHNHSISNVTDLQTNLDSKVDKVTGKGLSTNDYTTAEKNKLANIEAEANKTVVDSALSSTSTNPVQNNVIQSALNNKSDSNHGHNANRIVDENSDNYSNIGITTSWADQSEINDAINTALNGKADTSHTHSIANVTNLQSELDGLDSRIDSLESIKAIEVVSTLPTASSSTMNRLYIISENSKINVYYTEENSGSYAWHKMDSDILDELSISWSDVQNKPSTFPPSSHSHGYINNNGTMDYIEGDYNPVAIVGIDQFNDDIMGFNRVPSSFLKDSNAHSNIGSSANATQSTINTAIDTKIGTINTNIASKQDIGDCITSIELVPKSADSTGAIRLYYGDEE